MSLDRLLWAFGLLSTIIVGNVIYFLGWQPVLWLPYLIGLALYIKVIADLFSIDARDIHPLNLVGLSALVLYFLSMAISTFLNFSPFMQVIVGGKNLVAFWSVYILSVLALVRIATLERMMFMILTLLVVQIPVVLYQYIFIASQRSNLGGAYGVSWDAIVGTFGGDPYGGGNSGSLAFVVACAVLVAITLWSRGVLALRWLIGTFICAALCLMLAEVKVFVLLIIIGLIVISFGVSKDRPVATISMLVGGFVFVIFLLFYYGNTHVSDDYVDFGSGSIADVFEKAVGNNIDEALINIQTGEMSRVAALDFWWSEGFLKDPLHGVFGYGPGASRSVSSTVIGEVAKNYFFSIDRSSAAVILWEIGIFGLMALCCVIAIAFLSALLIAPRFQGEQRALLEAAAGILAMALIMLPYSREFTESPALTFVVMICLSFVAQSANQLSLRRY